MPGMSAAARLRHAIIYVRKVWRLTGAPALACELRPAPGPSPWRLGAPASWGVRVACGVPLPAPLPARLRSALLSASAGSETESVACRSQNSV